ncbi:DEAD/DEAH box helicase, partial [Candidatus Dependentiae bacterium]
TPTEIQQKAIPVLVSDKRVDFHGQAQTGTGKTLAFGIPLLQNIDPSKKETQALVIAPTRELVLQIVESLSKVAKFAKHISIEAIYGGVDITRQTQKLRRGVHIVIGTPGRLNDHIRRKNLNLNDLKTLVLDEADIMLDMGFRQEIDSILSKSGKNRQIWLFSATTKRGVGELKKTHMKDPVSVRVAQKSITVENTSQFYCMVPMKYRFKALCRIIDKELSLYGIVFCQTKLLCAEVASKLGKKGYNAASLHGDMDQKMRNKVIKRFKNRECDILVATDVASRGIDVDSLTHVINYSLPEDQESYVHRIGRTGRAGKEGTAITFVSNRDVRHIKSLSRRFSAEIKPFEVPSLKDLINARVSRAISFFNESCTDNTQLNGELDPLRSSINEMPKEKLVNVAINLLSDKFLNGYQHEEEIPSYESHEDSGGRYSDRRYSEGRRSDRKYADKRYENMSEIILHIGSEHGVEKSDVLQYCLDSQVLDRKQIERVRVIKRRSFVIVPSHVAKKVVNVLNRKKFQRKKIRIGIGRV